MVEAAVYLLVLISALLDVPSRQPVLDLSVGTRVLLDNDHLRPASGQDAGNFSACGSCANHRDDVTRPLCSCGFGHEA
jgi:hypothetical protein